MSRRNRHGDAFDPTIVETEVADIGTAAVDELPVSDSADVAAAVARYVPKPGELHRVDYMGRKKPARK